MNNNEQIIEFADLKSIRNEYKNENIVLCDGSFDLLHDGHILFIEEAKKLGDVLVVGVCKDNEVRRRKGAGRPIMNEQTRLNKVSSLPFVDYAFLKKDVDSDDWIRVVREMFETLSPDIYFTSDNVSELEAIMNQAKELGIKGRVFERQTQEKFKNLSTTEIIEAFKGTSS